jgi:hypothetical protein
MRIELLLTRDDLEKVFVDFCPLRVLVGDNGHIVLSDPRDVALVPDAGLRASVTAEVHWPVLGVQIPVSARSATLEVTPEVQKGPDGERLTFKLQLADADLSLVPASIARRVVDRVNEGLDAKHVELSWNFTKTLSHVFALPAALASAAAIDLRAASGSVRVTAEALVLVVSFHARVEPRVEPTRA